MKFSFSLVAVLWLSCSWSKSDYVIEFVEGTVASSYSVEDLQFGSVVRTRKRKSSDTLREYWENASDECVAKSDEVRKAAREYLNKEFKIKLDKLGLPDFLPGNLIIDDRDYGSNRYLFMFWGRKPAPPDPRFPSIPVSKPGSTSLYIYDSETKVIHEIASDENAESRPPRDLYDSLFMGLRYTAFNEPTGMVYYDVNHFAYCYDPVADSSWQLRDFDCVMPVRGSSMLLGYSLTTGTCTLLNAKNSPVDTVICPPILNIVSAHLLCPFEIIVSASPRKSPAFPEECYYLNFSSGECRHEGTLPHGQIVRVHGGLK